jgi:hypothetical protein
MRRGGANTGILTGAIAGGVAGMVPTGPTLGLSIWNGALIGAAAGGAAGCAQGIFDKVSNWYQRPRKPKVFERQNTNLPRDKLFSTTHGEADQRGVPLAMSET